MSPDAKVAVQVEGRTLTLTNLAKVLYPETGFAKAEVLDYYQRIAPVLLPHVAVRPVTLNLSLARIRSTDEVPVVIDESFC